MYSRLIILALILLIAYLLVRWFIRTPPQQVAAQLKKSALYIVVVIVAILAITGKLHWLFALFASLIPFAQRLLSLFRSYQLFKGVAGQFKNMGGTGQRHSTQSSSGQQSTITTAWLKVTLDHDTGDLSGVVLNGQFRGKRLEEMSLNALIALLADCRSQDEESAPLLETYMDRRFGEQWREQFDHDSTSNRATASGADLSVEECYEILGLSPNATIEDVKMAHRQLIQKVHPDRGGSVYLASKINKAKDILVDHLRKG